MPANMARWYVESSVYIALLTREIGVDPNLPRWLLAQSVLERALRGEVELVTSAYTIVEVNGGQSMAADPELRARVSALFRYPWLEIVEVDRLIAERARELIWQVRDSGSPLKNDDMIHLASALDQGCDKLLTWDAKHLIPLSGSSGIQIEPPQADGRQLPLI